MSTYYSVYSDFKVVRSLLSPSSLDHIHAEISNIITTLSNVELNKELDFKQKWFELLKQGRHKGGSLYNSLKGLPSIHEASANLCKHPAIKGLIKCPTIIDINARIDSYGEGHYLFDWHQDFWFLMASRSAKVVWIPLVVLSTANGGIKIATKYKSPALSGLLPVTKSHRNYASYSSSILLRDSINNYVDKSDIATFDRLQPGDSVIFDFLTPHASVGVPLPNEVRLTLQVRLGDLQCSEFATSGFKKCIHINENMTYLRFIDDLGYWNGMFPAP